MMTEVKIEGEGGAVGMKRGFRMFEPDSRHYGNCLQFAYWDGEPMCLLGPDAYMNIPLLVFVIGFLFWGEAFFISRKWEILSTWVFFVFKYFYLGVVVSLLLKNPGVRSRNSFEQPPGLLPSKDYEQWREQNTDRSRSNPEEHAQE